MRRQPERCLCAGNAGINSRVIGKQALQDNGVVVEYDGMDFSRHAEAGHSDPFLVSGGCQGNPLKERRNYDF